MSIQSQALSPSFFRNYLRWGEHNPNIVPAASSLKAPATKWHIEHDTGMKWEKYQTRPITEKEYRWLFKPATFVDGLGIICGVHSWRVFDFDTCPATDIIFEALEALGLPEDYEWVVETGSKHGFHIIFRCDALPNSHLLSAKKEEKGVFTAKGKGFDHLELRWGPCFTMFPPSWHKSGHQYTFLNDNGNGVPHSLPALIPGDRVVQAFLTVTYDHPQEDPKEEEKTQNKQSHPAWDALKKRLTFEKVAKWLGWTYTKESKNFVGECPLHDSESGTCLRWEINEEYFKCFHAGCGKTGDIVSFVSLFKGKSSLESAKLLAKEFTPDLLERFQHKQGQADKIADELALLGYTFTYSQIKDKVFINGDPITDVLFKKLYCEMVNRGFRGEGLIESVITSQAWESRFHPVIQYLDGLQWNHYANIEQLTQYISDEDNLFPLYFRKWLIGAVAKAYTGAQNPVLVLMGDQGIGKGEFSKWLCPSKDLFIESGISPDLNDHKIRLCERWIWQVGEINLTTRRAAAEALKDFLTLEMVTIRRPYAHFDIDKQALASFLGTINDDGSGFLVDKTGNRRFRPVTLLVIDWNYKHECTRDQLWAEAVAAYKAGETQWLNEEQTTRLNAHILPKYHTIDHLEDLLEAHYCHKEETESTIQHFLSTADILDMLYLIGYRGKNSRADAMAVSQCMKRLGYEKHTTGTIRGYKGIIKSDLGGKV